MSDDVTLRPMRWWDVERLLPLEQMLFESDAWSAETWWGELARVGADGGRHYVVIEQQTGTGQEPALLGYGGVGVNGSDADIMTMAVSPAAQGSGLGARLLDALLDHVREAGASQVLLEVRADNEPAQRLYRRRRFEQIARRSRYYGETDGLIMRLRPLGTG